MTFSPAPTPATDAAGLLLRASLAAMWLSHAWLKLGVFTMPGFEAFLRQQSLPPWIAWPVVLAEVAGALLIAVGAGGRWASLALLPILLGAAWVHGPNGWVFSAPQGGWEYPVFLAAMSVVHALLGDGRWALSARWRREPAGARAAAGALAGGGA